MPKAFDLKVTGIDALDKAINRLPGKLMNRVIVKGQSKSANLVAKEMRRRAPKGQHDGGGSLRKSIGRKSLKLTKAIRVVVVGVRKEYVAHRKVGNKMIKVVPHNYAHLIEFGHRRVKRDSKKWGFSRRGLRFSLVKRAGTGVQYGTALPRPFIRPALARREAIKQEFVKGARAQLALAIKEARGGK